MKQQDNVYELISLSASSPKGDAFYAMTMFFGQDIKKQYHHFCLPKILNYWKTEKQIKVEGCSPSHLLQGGDLTKDT